jgi:hypothetical protein
LTDFFLTPIAPYLSRGLLFFKTFNPLNFASSHKKKAYK